MHLVQLGLAHGGPWAKCSLPHVSVNKLWLNHSHDQPLFSCLSLLSCYKGIVEHLCLKYLLSGPLKKDFCDTWSRSSPIQSEGRVDGGEGDCKGNIPAQTGDLIKKFASTHFRYKVVTSYWPHWADLQPAPGFSLLFMWWGQRRRPMVIFTQVMQFMRSWCALYF